PQKTGGPDSQPKTLALAELEARTGAAATVLLALFGPRIAGQLAGGLERAAELTVDATQRASDAEPHRTGLTREPTTAGRGPDVVLLAGVGLDERLLDEFHVGRASQVALGLATIDGDLAVAGHQPHAGDGALAASGRVVLHDSDLRARRAWGFGLG